MFASYVIYSIKQTGGIRQRMAQCLLVMLFIVLSKHDVKKTMSTAVC